MLPRIHASTALQPGASLTLDGEQSHYLVRVLRLRAGAPVQVCDGRGARAQATLTQADAGRAQVLIGRVDARPTGSGVESPLHITLAQCLSSADKMDWTIEKACELGVAAIVPVMSQRSLIRLDAERGRRKVEHWQRVVAAACLQCGRDLFPSVAEPLTLPAWLESQRIDGYARGTRIGGGGGGDGGADTDTAAPADGDARSAPPATRLVLAPGAATRLREIDAPAGPIILLVGPESGLADRELEDATGAGLRPVSLGPRVLRTETAGLAAIAALQAMFGDL